MLTPNQRLHTLLQPPQPLIPLRQLPPQFLDLPSQILTITLNFIPIRRRFIITLIFLNNSSPLPNSRSTQLFFTLIMRLPPPFFLRLMTPSQMLIQIFFPGKPDAGAAFAVFVRTHAAGFGAAVLAVDFALVAEETAGVGEAADVVAFGFFADVGAVVLVHVFSGRSH